MNMEQYSDLVGREFRHFKGNLYRLEGFAKDSETLEEMVVYRALYGEHGLWVRPAKMFFEDIFISFRNCKGTTYFPFGDCLGKNNRVGPCKAWKLHLRSRRMLRECPQVERMKIRARGALAPTSRR